MNEPNPPIDVPSESSALVVREQQTSLDPVSRKAILIDTLNKVALVMEVMNQVMHEGEHYGTIPGCGDKKVLLKPGAEKLGMTFRLKPRFDVTTREYPGMHREYYVKCILSDGTEGVGTCSTLEAKYRYRSGERKCPKCGRNTIITGKAEYGGGFICFAKRGGCGAKFADTDKTITDQPLGKVEHENPADYWNTCLKMGKKRAHVDAIITATACGDIFTQDLEEMQEAAGGIAPEPAPRKAPPKTAEQPKTQAPEPKTASVPAKEPKTFTEHLEACKAALLKELSEDAHAEAWELFRKNGWIMENEDLDAAPHYQLFPSANPKLSWEENKVLVKKDHDNLLKCILENVPGANEPEHEEWRQYPMPFGKNAGVALEELDKKYLYGLWANYTVETEYNGKPKKPETIAKDQEFRVMLDMAGVHYKFTKDS